MDEEQEELKVIRVGPGYRNQERLDIDMLVGNRSPRLGELLTAITTAYAFGSFGPTVTAAVWEAFRQAVPTRLIFQKANDARGVTVLICRLPMRDPDQPTSAPTTHWRLAAVPENQLRYYRSLVYDQPILLSDHPFDPAIVAGGIQTVIEKALSTTNASRGVIIEILADSIASILVSNLPFGNESVTLMRDIAKAVRDVVHAKLPDVQLLQQQHQTPQARPHEDPS